jgi:hypothetical protein
MAHPGGIEPNDHSDLHETGNMSYIDRNSTRQQHQPGRSAIAAQQNPDPATGLPHSEGEDVSEDDPEFMYGNNQAAGSRERESRARTTKTKQSGEEDDRGRVY